jgi:hypothetical protein
VKDASCFLWAPGTGGLLSCSPRVAVRPGVECIVGLPGLTAEWGALWLTPPWLWVFVVQSGLGRFPVAPEGFNEVLGQLARWFYPFGSGAHCKNYYHYSPGDAAGDRDTAAPAAGNEMGEHPQRGILAAGRHSTAGELTHAAGEGGEVSEA